MIGTLAGVVSMFYRTQITDYKSHLSDVKTEAAAREAKLSEKILTLTERADECEEDREKLRIVQAVHEQRLQQLEAEIKKGMA